MGIFSGGAKNSRRSVNAAGQGRAATGADGPGGLAANGTAGATRAAGPFDRSEVDGPSGRIDVGALWLSERPGVEMRLEMAPESTTPVAVIAVMGESTIQMQAFAAPRSKGIWDDVRTEIAASITAAGGTADTTTGRWGPELRALVSGQGPGAAASAQVRLVGVQGPRWLLRAVVAGPAATDDEAAAALLDVLADTVVVRGADAMAPRELLELRLPTQTDQNAHDATAPRVFGPALRIDRAPAAERL